MKKIRLYIASLFIMLASTINAQPMDYNAMRNNARFLTDRMAYTLGITSAAIIDDIYRINYDYIYGVNEYLDEIACGYYSDLYDEVCYERDRALQYLLGEIIWRRIVNYDYFYRPITFSNKRWRFSIYSHDVRYTYYYYHTPTHYHEYRGGHFFNGIRHRIENHNRTMNSVDRRDHINGAPRNNDRVINNRNNNNRTDVNNDRNGGRYDNNSNYRENAPEHMNGAGSNRVEQRNNNNSERNYNRGENTTRGEGNNYNRSNRINNSENRSNNNVRSSSRNTNYNGSSSGSRGSYSRENNSGSGVVSHGSRGRR